MKRVFRNIIKNAIDAVNNGADDYKLKPVNSDILLAVIKEHSKKIYENNYY